jgi:hypothetical protein
MSNGFIRFLADLMSSAQTREKELEHPKPESPPDYDQTEQQIADMMQSNTGANILDSGGAYGRHWQSNREIVDFRELPEEATQVWNDGEINFTINLFHYLRKSLNLTEMCKQMQKDYETFAYNEENKSSPHWPLMKEFCEGLSEEMIPFNTYNFDRNFLSQVLQGVCFEWNNQWYVLLQIHNGCDVRGGYTDPVFFEIRGYDGYFDFLYGFDRYTGHCDCMAVDFTGYDEYEVWDKESGENLDSEFPEEKWKPMGAVKSPIMEQAPARDQELGVPISVYQL